jgi:hypothetical protein
MKVSLEVINFKQEIERIEREVTELAGVEITERIEYATTQLKLVTPVDTGEARMGWKNNIIKSRRGRFLDGTILNNVEHISHLNNGHSKQAPRYFIEQVLSTIGLVTPI